MIVLLAGLPGTGKSTLARALVRRLRGVVLDKDVVRAALFPPPYVEYSTEQDDFCQSVMLETAGYLLAKDRSLTVLLDGRTFSRRYQRDRAIEFAARLGVSWAVLECVCSEETALARLVRDLAQGTHPAANRTPELYHAIRAAFDPIAAPKLVVNTDEPLEHSVERVLGHLSLAGAQLSPS